MKIAQIANDRLGRRFGRPGCVIVSSSVTRCSASIHKETSLGGSWGDSGKSQSTVDTTFAAIVLWTPESRMSPWLLHPHLPWGTPRQISSRKIACCVFIYRLGVPQGGRNPSCQWSFVGLWDSCKSLYSNDSRDILLLLKRKNLKSEEIINIYIIIGYDGVWVYNDPSKCPQCQVRGELSIGSWGNPGIDGAAFTKRPDLLRWKTDCWARPISLQKYNRPKTAWDLLGLRCAQ